MSPIDEHQGQIQTALEGPLKAFDTAYARCFETDFTFLEPVLAHLKQGRGKRIRPILFFLCHDLIRPGVEADVRIPMLLELLHTASLIHDDVVDDSGTRRSEPTLNSRWDNQVAVLTGDYFFARMLTEAVAIGKPGIFEVIARCAGQMSLGELRQTLDVSNGLPSLAQYWQTIDDKTAALFSAACELAGWACGADPDSCKRLAGFGRAFGLVFQIRDDILDMNGDHAVMGKPRSQDARGGKATLPVILAAQNAVQKKVASLCRSLAQGDEAGAEAVHRFVADHGGIEAAQQEARRIAAEAVAHLDGFPESEAKTRLIHWLWADLERVR